VEEKDRDGERSTRERKRERRSIVALIDEDTFSIADIHSSIISDSNNRWPIEIVCAKVV
jgi:hypothetical protein